MRQFHSCLVGLAVLAAAGAAEAQVMTPQQGGQGQTYQPQPQPQPVQQEPQPVTAQQGRGLEYGAHLVVPIFITNPVAELVSPTGERVGGATAGFGLGLQARAGWEFGYGFAAELNIGATFNVMGAEEEGLEVDETLIMYWIGAGARYSFLNASALVPFVGAGAGLYFQSFCPNTAVECVADPAFAVNALAGLIYEVSPWVGLEAGVQFNAVFPNDTVFVETEMFLTPFVGATLYY